MNELNNCYNLLETLIPITNSMEYTFFGTFYCMLLEEWCKYNDKNINEIIDELHNLIIEINEIDGKY